MKHLKKYETFIGNLAKTRKFPENEYDIYKMNKRELGDYLNTWFEGDIIFRKDLPQNKIKKRNPDFQDYLISDEVWTVKEVDEKTQNSLYGRKYNPVSIKIMVKEYEKGKLTYDMKAQIHSVDDSQFGIWWSTYYGNNKSLEELKEIRLQLMKWINSQPIINGEEFFKVCIELGAAEESKDYN